MRMISLSLLAFAYLGGIASVSGALVGATLVSGDFDGSGFPDGLLVATDRAGRLYTEAASGGISRLGLELAGPYVVARAGMETTYWLEAVTPAFLARVDETLPAGARLSAWPNVEHYEPVLPRRAERRRSVDAPEDEHQ